MLTMYTCVGLSLVFPFLPQCLSKFVAFGGIQVVETEHLLSMQEYSQQSHI